MASAAIIHCNHCKKDVQYHFDPVDHKKQLFLSLITLGLWLPVWLGLTFRPTKMCNECNGPIWNDNK
ncbi:MAG: hypothetical protein JW818_17535 [Pirellulales bacterium]|nr:hypothetical protein [Pirellulales bacterium]